MRDYVDKATYTGRFESLFLKEVVVKVVDKGITERKKAEAGNVRAARVLLERERMMSAAIEDMLDAVMLVGMDGKLIYMNNACENLLGYKSEELVGKSALELPTYSKSKDKKRAKGILKNVLSGDIAEPVDMNIIGKEGNEIPVSFTASVIRDVKGTPETLVAVIRDISERKRAEVALRDSEEHYAALVGSITDAVFKFKDGVITWCNESVTDIYGYTREELIGKDVNFLQPLDISPSEFNRRVTRGIKEQGRYCGIARVMRKDGSTVDVEYTISHVKYIQGQHPIELIAVARDITERKRIEMEVLDYTRQIETLFNIGAVVNQTLNLTELLDIILDRVLEVMGIEAGGIFLLDKEKEDVVLRAYRGVSEEFVKKVEGRRIGEGFTGKAALSRKPLIVENIVSEPRLKRIGAKEEGLRSIATVPIVFKEKILGVISVGSYISRKFPEREVQLLGAIANQIGIAIENAQLYEQALELAFTDGLTGLYNRRYLMEQIEREFSRVARIGGSLSLIMIDLDGLKDINDRFGHHEGDVVLRGLGGIIKENTRSADVAARWGGDEFMLLTPDTHSKGARNIGERIKSQVSLYMPEINGEQVAISISVGIASYPGHASDVTQLLQKVDEAMYRAKRGGRNQLCVFSR